LRSTTSAHVQGISKSHIGTICEWSNDQTTIVSLILVSIIEDTVSLINLNQQLVLIFSRPTESELLQPLEVSGGLNLLLIKPFNNFSVVFLNSNEGYQLDSYKIR